MGQEGARGAGGADEADHFIEIVERNLEAEQEMLAFPRFTQLVIGAAADDIDADAVTELYR